MFDSIEKLKRDFTDKFVVVEAVRPELSRFKGRTGIVKTVNMNGRALVEFDANDNIGWYDIDLGCLKVVDRPPPKAAESKPAAKPVAAKAAPAKPAAPKAAPAVGEKKMSPLEMARAQGAAKTGDAPKKSTADVLAAARGGQAAPANPTSGGAAKPPAATKGKLSTADVLAAARAKTAGAETATTGAPAPPAPAASPPAAKPPAVKPPAVKPAAVKPAAVTGKKTTAEILAAARGAATSSAPSKAPPATPVAQTAPPAVEVVGSVPDQPISEQPVAAPPVATTAPVSAVEKPAAASKGDLPKTTPEIIAWCRQRDAKV